MPIDVSIVIPGGQLDEMRAVLDYEQFRKGVFQVIKRTTRSFKTRVVRRLHQSIRLPQRVIREAVKDRLTGGEIPVGIISVEHRSVPLDLFSGVRVTKRGGATIRFRKDKPAIRFPKGFRATYKGTRSIWQRVKGKVVNVGDRMGPLRLTKDGYAPRFPIRKILGTSVLSIVLEDGHVSAIGEELARDASEMVSKNVRNQIARFFAKPKAAANAGGE